MYVEQQTSVQNLDSKYWTCQAPDAGNTALNKTENNLSPHGAYGPVGGNRHKIVFT